LKDESRVGPYSNIQLSFSGLGMVEEGQKGIEGFFSAAVVGKDSGKRTSEQVEGEAEEEDDGKRMRLEGPVLEEDVPIIAPPDPPIPSFTCPRCSKVLILPPSAIDSLRPTFDPITMEQLLAKERSEHDDYHFARDMLESERKGARSAPVVGKKVVVPSKSKVKPGGQQTLSGFFKQG
jgi:DNA polymerase eta